MREGYVKRNTRETDIEVNIAIDGKGTCACDTKIGFFDHMLELFAKHGLFDLQVKCNGDINVDFHHSVEDVGIALGQAFLKALGDKAKIKRYGYSFVPMDETLAFVSLDISGRPYMVYDVAFKSDKTGDFEAELVEEFMRAFAYNAGITLHIKLIYGTNTHHIIEGVFKALSCALDTATTIDSRRQGIPSTKGVL